MFQQMAQSAEFHSKITLLGCISRTKKVKEKDGQPKYTRIMKIIDIQRQKRRYRGKDSLSFTIFAMKRRDEENYACQILEGFSYLHGR